MAYQDNLRKYLGEIARYGEPALTAGSAMAAEPISGLVGLGYTLTGRGNDAAVNAINATQQSMTYQPRTLEGQQGLQGLQAFLQPIGDVIQGASQNLGDKAYSATGSPAIAAAAYSAPTALLEGLGLKGLGIARKPVSGADLYSVRMGAGGVDSSIEYPKLSAQEKIKHIKSYLTEERLSDLLSKAESEGFNEFGLRVVTKNPKTGRQDNYSVGDDLPESFDWVDGSPTIDTVGGTSTIGIDWDGWDVKNLDKQIKLLEQYLPLGDEVVIVAGKTGRSFEGNDVGERVIPDATVIDVVK